MEISLQEWSLTRKFLLQKQRRQVWEKKEKDYWRRKKYMERLKLVDGRKGR